MTGEHERAGVARALSHSRLEALEQALQRQAPDVARALRPGIDEDVLFAMAGDTLVSSDARVWWTWHDGCDADMPLGEVLSFELSLRVGARHRVVAQQLEQDHASAPEVSAAMRADRIWSPAWLVLFESGGSTRWVLDCDVPEGHASRVLEHDFQVVAQGGPREFAPSLDALVGRWIDELESGAIAFDKSSGWRRVLP